MSRFPLCCCMHFHHVWIHKRRIPALRMGTSHLVSFSHSSSFWERTRNLVSSFNSRLLSFQGHTISHTCHHHPCWWYRQEMIRRPGTTSTGQHNLQVVIPGLGNMPVAWLLVGGSLRLVTGELFELTWKQNWDFCHCLNREEALLPKGFLVWSWVHALMSSTGIHSYGPRER